MNGPFCTTCGRFIFKEGGAIQGNRVCAVCVKSLAEQIGILLPKETEEEIVEELLADIDWQLNNYVEDAVNDAIRKVKRAREEASEATA